MIITIKNNENTFNELFEKYKQNFDRLKELHDEVLPQNYRLFDIRFRLALSLQISFNRNISYTKTENTRKTYQMLLKINNLWFAYEGLLGICKALGYYKNGLGKADTFTEQTMQEFDFLANIQEFNAYLSTKVAYDIRGAKDLENYILHLQTKTTGKSQGQLLQRVQQRLTNQQDWKLNEILAVVYATRNLYVHQADTAKSGVFRYKTKIELLKASYDFIVLISLKTSIYIFEKLADEME